MREEERDLLLDEQLAGSLPELPPDDVARAVTPWRGAMNRILAGAALQAILLNFLCLNYILPAIGAVLTLLGYRALRRENGWFRGGFVCALARTVWLLVTLAINATIYHETLNDLPVMEFLTGLSAALQFVQFLCLWRGLCAVKGKAGLPERSASAGALLVWYAAACALGLMRYSGQIFGWAMIVAYILILRCLYKASKELDEAGYAVAAAPVRVPDWAVSAILAAVLAAALAVGYVFFDAYPMDFEPVTETQDAAVREELLALGFPADVLDDLTAEDILSCAGARRVVVSTEDHPVNDGRSVTEQRGNTIHHTTVYDVKELRLTHVAVELPGEREQWRIFHHFRWTVDPGFYGTEAIQLWPTSHVEEGWAISDGALTGRVLCELDGQTCAAPYHFLGRQTYTSNSIFWGEQTATDYFASFSLPRTGENCRGYVAYTAAELRGGYIIDSWMNYVHQSRRLQYPAATAMETRMANSLNHAGAFITIQDILQFFPDEE